MPTIRSGIEIAAPPDALFDLAQSYELRLVWDPFLRAMRFLDGATTAAVGTRVWVRAKNGLTMEVRYITLERPTQVAMTMTRGPAVFRQFAGAWNFRAIADGRTQVVFKYNYALRPAWLAPVLEPVVTRVLQHDMDARLAALKRSAEQTDILTRLPPPT